MGDGGTCDPTKNTKLRAPDPRPPGSVSGTTNKVQPLPATHKIGITPAEENQLR